MRIKHTKTECYRVCNYLPMTGTFKDCKRWYPYKFYSSKQSALNAIKRAKIKDNRFVWRIDWFSSPYAREYTTIYDESED